MKLSVLTENTASGFFTAEHGLSYFIEHDGMNLIFDTGHTDVFLRNAEKLNLPIYSTEIIVLSHGHWDHGNGLKYLKNKTLVCHPVAFMKRYRKSDKSYIGLDTEFKDLEKNFRMVLTREPYAISDKIIFLGEIPRNNPFEAQTTPFVDENMEKDFVPDDSALAIIQNEELIVVTGCSHAGICNIIEYAKKIAGINRVHAVIGGFHLKEKNLQTRETIDYLKKQDIKHVFPSHCTDLPALSAFYDAFKIKQVKSGMIFQF